MGTIQFGHSDGRAESASSWHEKGPERRDLFNNMPIPTLEPGNAHVAVTSLTDHLKHAKLEVLKGQHR